MKDYLQPAATFALALAIASLGFTLPQKGEAVEGRGTKTYPLYVRHLNNCASSY